jgi:hypothetical protein
MRISTLERGKTEVELLVFTKNGTTEYDGINVKELAPKKAVNVTPGELEAVNVDWKGFFGEAPALVMDQWAIEGDIQTYQVDVRAR